LADLVCVVLGASCDTLESKKVLAHF